MEPPSFIDRGTPLLSAAAVVAAPLFGAEEGVGGTYVLVGCPTAVELVVRGEVLLSVPETAFVPQNWFEYSNDEGRVVRRHFSLASTSHRDP